MLRRIAVGVAAPCLVIVLAVVLGWGVARSLEDPRSLAVVFGWGVTRLFEDRRPQLLHETVTGVWRGADGSELAFNDDGTFVVTQFPASLMHSLQNVSDVVDGTGRWLIEAAVGDPSGRKTRVVLIIEKLEGPSVPSSVQLPYAAELISEFIDGKIALLWYIGDPDLDRWFAFYKF